MKRKMIIAVLALAPVMAQDAVSAVLTDSTSLTIVRVTRFREVDVTQWTGAWPSSPSASLTPSGMEMYLKSVFFNPRSISWVTTPSSTPYPNFGNGLNSLISSIWSIDGGKTYTLQSWDYLAANTRIKELETGMPNCWMGTMVHSYCDNHDGACNGRYRSNLFFTAYPSGNTACWGLAVMK